ncbi:MAG TPA: hypothetical protein VI357_01355 [Mycobacteriales bacterium]
MTATTPATPPGEDRQRSREGGVPGRRTRTWRRGAGGGRTLYWLLPVLAFLGGLLLGGGIIAATDIGSSDQTAAGPAEPARPGPTTSTSPGDRTITVPASCADGLDKADAALQAARDGIDALGDLDGTAARQALDRLVTLRPEITDLADRCRAAAGSGS